MVVNCGLMFAFVYTNLSLHLMIFPFVSTWPRPLRPAAAATAAGLRSFSVDMPTQTEDKQGISDGFCGDEKAVLLVRAGV